MPDSVTSLDEDFPEQTILLYYIAFLISIEIIYFVINTVQNDIQYLYHLMYIFLHLTLAFAVYKNRIRTMQIFYYIHSLLIIFTFFMLIAVALGFSGEDKIDSRKIVAHILGIPLSAILVYLLYQNILEVTGGSQSSVSSIIL